MTYCSAADIQLPESTLIQLTDDSGNGTVDSAVLSEAIDSAQSEVDATLLAMGLTVPLSEAPPLIVVITADLALSRLYLRRWDASELPESIKNAARQARQLLEDIRSGRKLVPGLATVRTGQGVYLGNKSPANRRFPQSFLEKI